MTRAGMLAVAAIAPAACSSDDDGPTIPTNQPAQYIAFSGTFGIEALNGRGLPVIVGSTPCGAASTPRTVTGGSITLTPGAAGVQSPFSTSLVVRSTCGQIVTDVISRGSGTYVATAGLDLMLTWGNSASPWLSRVRITAGGSGLGADARVGDSTFTAALSRR